MSTRILFFLGLVFLPFFSRSYESISRFQLENDRFHNSSFFSFQGHNYIFSLASFGSQGVSGIFKEAKSISRLSGGTLLNQAQNFLAKLSHTEHFFTLESELKVPLKSFRAKNFLIKPYLNFILNLGTLSGIQSEPLSISTIIDYIGGNIPVFIRERVIQNFNNIPAGADIIGYIIDNDPLVPSTSVTESYRGLYFMPTDSSFPILDIYGQFKSEMKLGFNYKSYENYYGYFNIVLLPKFDFRLKVSADTIANNRSLLKIPKEKNTSYFIALDYKLGRKANHWNYYFSIDNFNLYKLVDNEEKGGKLYYDNEALFRFYGEYSLGFNFFELRPYLGLHKRKGYTVKDGFYLGVHADVWKLSKYKASFQTQLDREYLFLGTTLSFKGLDVGYTWKNPFWEVRSNIIISNVHSFYLRTHF